MTDLLLDLQTPEQHRQRYTELRASARERAAGPILAPARELPDADIIRRERVPASWYSMQRLRRGEALRLVNTIGGPGVSVLLWNADDTSERLNLGDTLKLQWTARLAGGRVLFSDMGRVLASIIADSCGRHDALLGGGGMGLPGTRSNVANFRLAVGKAGMGPRDVPPWITFFAHVGVDEHGALRWQDGATKAGDIVDLRAEMNLLVAVSNCPHPLAPSGMQAGPIELVVFSPPPATTDDPCRHFGEEVERGFENTDALSGSVL